MSGPIHISAAESVAIPMATLPPGGRTVVTVGRREIAVFNVDGTVHAVSNLCPHQRAPLVAGTIGGTRVPSDVGRFEYGLDAQVLRCPWHAYEFDLLTGRCLADPARLRVRVYQVEQHPDEVVVHV